MPKIDNGERRLCELNDEFRKFFIGGQVVVSACVQRLPPSLRSSVMRQVQEFDAWTPADDMLDDHSRGSFEADGHQVVWNISYRNEAMGCIGGDATEAIAKTRVLTVRLVFER